MNIAKTIPPKIAYSNLLLAIRAVLHGHNIQIYLSRVSFDNVDANLEGKM